MNFEQNTVTRRRVMQTAVSASVLAFAGCAVDTGDSYVIQSIQHESGKNILEDATLEDDTLTLTFTDHGGRVARSFFAVIVSDDAEFQTDTVEVTAGSKYAYLDLTHITGSLTGRYHLVFQGEQGDVVSEYTLLAKYR